MMGLTVGQSVSNHTVTLHAKQSPSQCARSTRPSLYSLRSSHKDRLSLCRSDSPETPNITESTSSSTSDPSADSFKEALRAAEAQNSASTSTKRQADSTDWIASQLTRRFGIAGGLAWLGFLTFGVVGEQIKTRIEVAEADSATKDVASAKEVLTPEGLRYLDQRIGGGAPPQKGYLIVLDYKAYANGQLFEDTKVRGKPIVFLYGARPFSGGVCRGVEIALQTMKAGGKRKVFIPAALGFGESGATLRPTEHVPEKQAVVPPGADLEYELELQRVSIPPS